MAETDPRHAPRTIAGRPALSAAGLHASFDVAADVRFGPHRATLRATSLGRGDRRVALAGTSARIAGPEVRAERAPGVVEWWRSLASGLEHGITIAKRPRGDGLLTVELEVRGDLSPHRRSHDEVELRDRGGELVATYAQLAVIDADGAEVPARMSARGDTIVLSVDDVEARYPLVVDPLLIVVEDTTLLASDGMYEDHLGVAVSLSADGSRALVGVPDDDTPAGVDAGSARVFVRSGTTWSEEATLMPAVGSARARFGAAVALADDGTRALVGAPNDGGTTWLGTARVFARTGDRWTEEATLVAADGAPGDAFGTSVALSADGSRALVGALYDNIGPFRQVGSAHVFVRMDTTWREEATLLGRIDRGYARFGCAVALSGDGDRALVGAYFDFHPVTSHSVGSARVFVRSGEAWAEEAALFESDGASDDRFGSAVSLSADGGVALIGAPYAGSGGRVSPGGARVFVRESTRWTEDATLRPSGAPDTVEHFGTAVALSSDGSHALVGAYLGSSYGGYLPGSAWMFAGSGSGWREELSLIAPRVSASFGSAVSVNEDGTAVCVGAPGEPYGGGPSSGAGAAHLITLRPADPNGSPCASPSTCVSDFCTDGVCCDTDCGAGATDDCQACSVAAGTVLDGRCGPLTLRMAGSITCRPARAECDLPERCVPDSPSCPADSLAAVGMECRASVAACDPAETCDGLTEACPADESTCADEMDAGGDFDAGSGGVTGGCGCRATRGTFLSPLGALAAFLLLASRRRRTMLPLAEVRQGR